MVATSGKGKSRWKIALDGLLWPAVAGNVLWSAMTLLAVQGGPESSMSVLTRFSTLFCLGAYLTVDFVLTDPDEAYPLYWFAEVVHLAILTTVALGIGSPTDLSFLSKWLYWLLGSNVAFNLIGAWDDLLEWKLFASRDVWRWRIAFATASGAGLVALRTLSGRPDGVQFLVAVGITTLVYSLVAFRKRGFWEAR